MSIISFLLIGALSFKNMAHVASWIEISIGQNWQSLLWVLFFYGFHTKLLPKLPAGVHASTAQSNNIHYQKHFQPGHHLFAVLQWGLDTAKTLRCEVFLIFVVMKMMLADATGLILSFKISIKNVLLIKVFWTNMWSWHRFLDRCTMEKL